MISHRSDVWSGCVTMMDILVGKGTQSELHKEVDTYTHCLVQFMFMIMY